jgi:DegV family protein with EDD domain
MAKVGIVTDSISCVDPQKAKEYGVKIVPLTVNINGKTYRDQIDLSTDGFWKLFPDIKEFSTGAPAIAEYTRAFEELSQTADSIACTCVTKALSASTEAALQARDIFQKTHPDIKVEVIDSRSGMGAQGFIALEMARAAEAGKTLEQIVDVANQMIPKVRFCIALETLKYLVKFGRAPKTAYLGELFQVKPIIGMVNNKGILENLGKARGLDKAMIKLVEVMKNYIDPNKPAHFNVHYSNSMADGEKLKDMVTSEFNSVELYFTPFSSVMCTATGPVVAVSFYS